MSKINRSTQNLPFRLGNQTSGAARRSAQPTAPTIAHDFRERKLFSTFFQKGWHRRPPPVPSGDPPDGISKPKPYRDNPNHPGRSIPIRNRSQSGTPASGPAKTRNRQTPTAEKLRQERPICSTQATLASKLHSERHKTISPPPRLRLYPTFIPGGIAPKSGTPASRPANTRNRQTPTAEKLRQERPICSTRPPSLPSSIRSGIKRNLRRHVNLAHGQTSYRSPRTTARTPAPARLKTTMTLTRIPGG